MTNNGLALTKARAIKLGNSNLSKDNHIRREKARKFAETLRPTLEGYIRQGMTQRAIVDELNSVGIKANRGGQWSLVQLQHVLNRLGLRTQRTVR